MRSKLFLLMAGFGLGLAVSLTTGCESSPTPSAVPEQTTMGAPVPSANVNKYQAWKDASMLSDRGTGREALVGGGDSMNPVYGDNTMLVISPIDYAQLKPGMTVVYTNRFGRRVAHQLIAKENKGWRAQGLNNPEEDSDLVTPDNLIGVVYASLSSELKE